MASPFAEKDIVLGVTGSIAAYKAAELASRLVEGGARVTAVLTESARHFIGAATFEAITGRPVVTDLFTPAPTAEIEHITVAQRAALVLVAPATANVLARAAHGLADDWLSAALLATRAPVLFAPAMNTQMWQHPATQANVALLKDRGCHFAGPGEGMLACRTVGPGRLIEPAYILEAAAILLQQRRSLEGRTVLLTTGGNHEPIDPVRYIGNRSSGKMGRAIALEALARGARVIAVAGPSEVALPHGVEILPAGTSREMLDAVAQRLPESDIFVGAAAVADYRVERPATQKQKRNADYVTLSLVPNPDITAHVGLHKREGQVAIGFAAETHDALRHAQEKLKKKQLDCIVANEVNVPDSGFGSDTSRAWLIRRDGEPQEWGLITKSEVAARLFDEAEQLLSAGAGLRA